MTDHHGGLEHASTPFPRRQLTIGVAAMFLLLSCTTLLTWRVSSQIQTTIDTQINVLTDAEKVAHYGDVLELSIKAVVANGDQAAAERYRTVQPQLRTVLTQLKGTVGLNENKSTVHVDQADLDLIAIEYQTLDLVDKGRFEEARGLINGQKYDHLVKVDQEGVAGIAERSRNYVAATNEELHWYLRSILFLSLAAFGLIGLAWVLIVRPAHRWGDQLDEARESAEQALQQLSVQKEELKLVNRKLFDQARVDHLTKLNTRLKLSEDLEIISARASRYGERYCAVMCDIDYFKHYNDTYGHPAGDEVLRNVARALAESCRGGDQVYRYGGEEFLIIMPASSLEGARKGAERHRTSIQTLAIPHEGSPFGFVTGSMGLAILTAGGPAAVAAWIEKADAALYRAKREGKNRVVAAAADINAKAA